MILPKAQQIADFACQDSFMPWRPGPQLRIRVFVMISAYLVTGAAIIFLLRPRSLAVGISKGRATCSFAGFGACYRCCDKDRPGCRTGLLYVLPSADMQDEAEEVRMSQVVQKCSGIIRIAGLTGHSNAMQGSLPRKGHGRALLPGIKDPRSSRSDHNNQSGRRLAAAPASLR